MSGTGHAGAFLLRDRDAPDHGKVSFIELFFDLVFVFAVTRLSHHLLAHLSWQGALETGFLTIAVWIVWMWTTWATNWLDTMNARVRLMLFAVMGLGLLMSASIPEAFGDRALWFAVAYAGMHQVRSIFFSIALRNGKPNELRNFQRVHVWLTVAAAFWIAGGLVEDNAVRWALWVTAVLIELAGPWFGLWVPGMGKSTTEDWAVDTAHMAERCGLFVILALGESIIVMGATFSDAAAWTATNAAAFAIAFAGSVAMWWIYFAGAAEEAEHIFAHRADRGRVARNAYSYAHIPIVAGVILTAVGDELLLAHPTGHLEASALACVVGGPILFLAGMTLFARLVCDEWNLELIVPGVLLAALFPLGFLLPPLVTTGAATLILIGGGWALWRAVRKELAADAAREAVTPLPSAGG